MNITVLTTFSPKAQSPQSPTDDGQFQTAEVTGESYEAALEEAIARVPEGWLLSSIRVERE